MECRVVFGDGAAEHTVFPEVVSNLFPHCCEAFGGFGEVGTTVFLRFAVGAVFGGGRIVAIVVTSARKNLWNKGGGVDVAVLQCNIAEHGESRGSFGIRGRVSLRPAVELCKHDTTGLGAEACLMASVRPEVVDGAIDRMPSPRAQGFELAL
jgi:hypothetical protein